MSTLQSMAAGVIAGTATVLITNPIWVVNVRMTTTKKSKKKPSTLKTVFQILQDDGPLTFWQGVVPALILVINPVIQYTVFEQMKGRIERSKKLAGWHFFVLGAISKLIATGLTYPYM